MSARFAIASQQIIENAAPPISTYPITMGMWFKMDAATAAVQQLWGLSDTASNNNFFRLTLTAGELLSASVKDSGTAASAATLATAVVAGQWTFCISRFISATSRHIAAMYQSGLIEHATNAVSRTPPSCDLMTVGGRRGTTSQEWFGGDIAEFWYTSSDIQADGAQLQNSTLRHLARYGPFSLPHIAKDIVEYRAFRSCLTSDQDQGTEIYTGAGKTRQVWTNTNTAILAAHCPLPGCYRRPVDIASVTVF